MQILDADCDDQSGHNNEPSSQIYDEVNTAILNCPDSKVHGANMGPTQVLSALDGPHIGPMKLVIKVYLNGITHERFSANKHSREATIILI